MGALDRFLVSKILSNMPTQLIDTGIIFAKAHLQPGMHVADFGSGKTGHIVFPAAAILGERGLIYAVDIMKPTLENISRRAALENFHNIETIWSDVEHVGATAIPAHTLDLVFIIGTLAHTDHKHNMLDEANRLLKDKSRLVVVDWARDGLPFSPKKENMVSFPDVIAWGQTNNFFVQEEFEAGDYHHGIVLYKHD